MANYPVRIIFDSRGFIRVGLPITSPTGKIRVKEKSNIYDFGTPFRTRQDEINSNCYIEWQIGYDNPDPNAQGVVREIMFNRGGEIKYGFELTNILYTGVRNHVYPESIIDDLLKFAVSVNEDSYIDKVAEIERTHKGSVELCGLNFQKIEETYPVFLFTNQDYDIEVVIKHKQRAVGYMSMIYVCLPLSGAIETDIIGRIANLKEFLNYKVETNKNNFVFDTFKVFSLASDKHNKDIKNILITMKEVL